MGTQFEKALITAVIEGKDFKTTVRRKITPSYFFDTDSRAMWAWLEQWFQNPEYTETPSWERVMDQFPNFEPMSVDDSVAALCDKVREGKLYNDLSRVLSDVANATKGDVTEGFDRLRELTSKLSTEHLVSDAVDLRSLGLSLAEQYQRMQQMEVKLKGWPWPWEELTDATMGAQRGQVGYIYGRPKAKKTWCALAAARSFRRCGAKGLIISQELPTDEMNWRIVAVDTEVDYTKLLRGELPPEQEEVFYAYLSELEDSPPYVVDSMYARGDAAESELLAKIEDSGADFVLIDGVHTLGNDWKELKIVTQMLKRVAKRKEVYILGTTHANRGGKDSEVGDSGNDFGHSDSFFQDCDLALRLKADLEHRAANELLVWTSAIRGGRECAFSIHTSLCRNLNQKKVLTVTAEDHSEVEEGVVDGGDDER